MRLIDLYENPAARYLGLTLSLAAIGYLIWLGFDARAEFSTQAVLHIVPELFFASVIYAVICVLIGAAWHLLLRIFEPGVLSWQQSVCIYAISQVAKYLPTNTLHFIGRYAMGRAAGTSPQALVSSTMIEQGLILCIAVLLGASALPSVLELIFDQLLSKFSIWPYVLIATIFLGLGFIARQKITAVYSTRSLPYLCSAAILIALFFLATSGLFLYIGKEFLLPNQHFPDFLWTTSVIALAWAIGMAVPGASAGIGLREFVIVSALDTNLPVEVLLLVVLGFRIMTVAGDVLVFIAGVLMRKQYLNS